MKRIFTYLFLILFFVLFNTNAAFSKIWEIHCGSLGFQPVDLNTVVLGDTIEWIWDEGDHYVKSINIPSGADSIGGELSIDSTSFYYVPSKIGEYKYICETHASFGIINSFTVSAPSNIPEPDKALDFSIEPNPATKFITLTFYERINSIKVYNINGQLMEAQLHDINQNSKVLDISKFPSGVYIIELYDKYARLRKSKFVKE